MIVERIMTRDVACCSPNHTLDQAVRLMADYDCGCLPVVDGETITGIVTDRDACMAACNKNALLADIRVGDVMSRHVRTCRATDELALVEQQMSLFKVRRIPVVDDRRRVVGMVSLDDLAMVADRGREKLGFPTAAEVTHTLASICSPPMGTEEEEEIEA
jgi:CBS domain-containing protein